MAHRLDGKTAVVTGGSRGIGKATVQYLAEKGAKVLFTARNEETLQRTQREMRDLGYEVTGMAADLRDPATAGRVIDACLDQMERLDILVNNAGITQDALAIRMKDEDWNAVLEVNLGGAFSMSRAAAKVMLKARTGRIILVSSVVGLMGNAGQVNYAASKAGMIGLAKSLAKELASRGITVNVVAPGFIETDMTAEIRAEIRETVLKNIPLGRFGKAEEIAAMIGFLASEEAGYITGQVFTVDGGLHM